MKPADTTVETTSETGSGVMSHVSDGYAFSFFEVWPDKVRPCAGTCGGNVYEPWAWQINGKFYCGDCADLQGDKPYYGKQ
ncbi:MAG: hypothetical protein M0R74_10660 [Dehalococcoidia bacterium]|nr:hypothetical protein [Dehalococcoidia bacterium]